MSNIVSLNHSHSSLSNRTAQFYDAGNTSGITIPGVSYKFIYIGEKNEELENYAIKAGHAQGAVLQTIMGYFVRTLQDALSANKFYLKIAWERSIEKLPIDSLSPRAQESLIRYGLIKRNDVGKGLSLDVYGRSCYESDKDLGNFSGLGEIAGNKLPLIASILEAEYEKLNGGKSTAHLYAINYISSLRPVDPNNHPEDKSSISSTIQPEDQHAPQEFTVTPQASEPLICYGKDDAIIETSGVVNISSTSDTKTEKHHEKPGISGRISKNIRNFANRFYGQISKNIRNFTDTLLGRITDTLLGRIFKKVILPIVKICFAVNGIAAIMVISVIIKLILDAKDGLVSLFKK